MKETLFKFKGIIGQYGQQSYIAKVLGVSRSTVCRDMQAIRRACWAKEERQARLCERILKRDFPFTRKEIREYVEIIRETGERSRRRKKAGRQ